MHPIPQVLNASGEPVDGELPPPLIKIVGPECVIRFLTGEHMKDTDHDRVGHGDDGLLLPTAYGETLIQRREIGALGMHGRMRQLGQDRPEGLVILGLADLMLVTDFRYGLALKALNHNFGFRLRIPRPSVHG